MFAGRYEIRRPKVEGRKKPEFRNSKARELPQQITKIAKKQFIFRPFVFFAFSGGHYSEFAASDFFRPSDSGFRILTQPSVRPVGTRAFTLVEMMVVVVLIGILTAMIIPEMKGTYEDALLRSTSRELINAFSLASSRAVSMNQMYRVRLDRRSGHYYVEKRVLKGSRQPEFIPVPDVSGAQGELDGRILVQMRPVGGGSPEAFEPESNLPSRSGGSAAEAGAAGEAVGFYSDGTADAAELLLRDRAGFQLVLRINPITAHVRVVELARASEPRP